MRYRAFISYASADRLIGERFQRAIEHFRIPKPLRGADHGFGAVPKRLTPLFRDRSDASAGRDLGVTLRTALESSDALVVLCSPVSAQSKWVNEEIRTFKRLGRNARIFPVLIDGQSRRHDPQLAPAGAFPPALFERFDASGAPLEGEDPTPLAPDLRDNGDGLNFARLKIVAALTGVPLTLLTQRQQEAERREKLIARVIAAVMAMLALLASAAAVQAWRSAETARARLEDSISMASGRVADAASYQDEYGVPSKVISKMLNSAKGDFDDLIGDRDTGTPTLELQRGRLSVMFSGLYGQTGDSKRQLDLARDGLRTIEAVTTTRQLLRPSTWFARLPGSGEVVGAQLGALEALGTALDGSGPAGTAEATRTYERGRKLAEAARRPIDVARFSSLIAWQRYNESDLKGALAAQDAAIATLATVSAKDSTALANLRHEQALAHSDRAETLLELERHREALAEQRAAITALQAEASAMPEDTSGLHSEAQARARYGDTLYAVTGDWRESGAQFERAISILGGLHASDQARIDYARSLSLCQERLGDVRLQAGDLAGARSLYDSALQLRRDILARDPGRADAVRDVAVALERQGQLALAQGSPRQALVFLDEALGLYGATESDTSDKVKDRDMAVFWRSVGQARAGSGMKNWEEAFTNAMELSQVLIDSDGALPGWMRDMAAIQYAYGEALARAGREAEAISQWNAALRLTERQLALNEGDPRLNQDRDMLRRRIAGQRSEDASALR